MKVLVVGGGGREHAIVWKLARSRHKPELYAAPGNAGISALARCLPYKATDLDGICDWARGNKPDLVFVAPDDPLALGLVDLLEECGVPAFGPRKNAALFESSKVFSKAFMEKYRIPTARYQSFDDCGAALAHCQTQAPPLVIKADGLALGKGVVIAQTRDEATRAVTSMMRDGAFGTAGGSVVIEEYMTGPEVTVLAFTDGETVRVMPPSQDHKRARDNDEGPNTGGMGVICPPPQYTPDIAKRCMNEIFLPTVRGMAAEGRPFQGVLYFGLMLTPEGPRVVEYNARFGDPEAQAVLPLLESDLLDICLAVREKRLSELDIHWSPQASACVVLASGGYPGNIRKGLPVTGLDNVGGAVVFHAGTALENGRIVTSGGRVLAVTATADTLRGAVDAAYEAVKPIHFDGGVSRSDIGKRALEGV